MFGASESRKVCVSLFVKVAAKSTKDVLIQLVTIAVSVIHS